MEPILLARRLTSSRFEGTVQHRKLIILLSDQAIASAAVLKGNLTLIYTKRASV